MHFLWKISLFLIFKCIFKWTFNIAFTITFFKSCIVDADFFHYTSCCTNVYKAISSSLLLLILHLLSHVGLVNDLLKVKQLKENCCNRYSCNRSYRHDILRYSSTFELFKANQYRHMGKKRNTGKKCVRRCNISRAEVILWQTFRVSPMLIKPLHKRLSCNILVQRFNSKQLL